MTGADYGKIAMQMGKALSLQETGLTIRVYIDNGVAYEYEVKDATSAREHADAIIKGGYRHNDGEGDFIHYPSHRVAKVRVIGGPVPTLYPDRATGT